MKTNCKVCGQDRECYELNYWDHKEYNEIGHQFTNWSDQRTFDYEDKKYMICSECKKKVEGKMTFEQRSIGKGRWI